MGHPTMQENDTAKLTPTNNSNYTSKIAKKMQQNITENRDKSK